MRKLNQFVLLLAGILMVNVTLAQKAEAPTYTYDVGGNIEKMILTDSGVLLVTHGTGLAGIKPGKEGLVFYF